MQGRQTVQRAWRIWLQWLQQWTSPLALGRLRTLLARLANLSVESDSGVNRRVRQMTGASAMEMVIAALTMSTISNNASLQ